MYGWHHILAAAFAVSSLVLQPVGLGMFQCADCCAPESEESCCRAPARSECCKVDAACCQSSTSLCCAGTNTSRPADCSCGKPHESFPETPLSSPVTADADLEMLALNAPVVWQSMTKPAARSNSQRCNDARSSDASTQIMLCVWLT